MCELVNRFIQINQPADWLSYMIGSEATAPSKSNKKIYFMRFNSYFTLYIYIYIYIYIKLTLSDGILSYFIINLTNPKVTINLKFNLKNYFISIKQNTNS